MPRHSLFPNSITIHYTTNDHDHSMVLPVGVVAGSAPAWTLPVRVGSPVDWRDAVDAFALLVANLFDDADSVDYAELFTYEATGSPAEFLAAHTINQPGTSVSTAVAWSQAVFPFKAIGGNSLRLTLLEAVMQVDQHVPYSGLADANLEALVDFILSDDDWLLTRGGTYPTVSLGMTTKINDKLREKYLLDV